MSLCFLCLYICKFADDSFVQNIILKKGEVCMLKCNLKKYLKSRNITQGYLSRRLNIDRNVLGRLANGNAKSIKCDIVEKVCTYLGIGVGELFEIIDEKICKK